MNLDDANTRRDQTVELKVAQQRFLEMSFYVIEVVD